MAPKKGKSRAQPRHSRSSLECPSPAPSSADRPVVVRCQSIVFPLRPAFVRRPPPSPTLRCGAAATGGMLCPRHRPFLTPVGPDTLFIEGDLLGQHLVDGSAELGGQHAQRLGFAAFLLLLLHPLLGPFAAAQK